MKKPFKIILYSVLGLIGIVFLTFLPGIILGLFMISGGCDDEVIQTVPLEKGKIELHRENCGAMSSYDYGLSFTAEKTKDKPFNAIEINYGTPSFKLVKETKDKVIISYSPGIALEKTHVKLNQKDFYFKKRNIKINAPKEFLSMKRSLKGLDLTFYSSTLELYKHPESIKNQLGISIDDEGNPLKDYDPTWFRIGYFDAHADKLSSDVFINVNEKNYPVYIEVESKKKTEKMKIASSYQNFEHMISLIKETGYGKDYCDNPAKDKKLEEKRTEILTIFKQENPDSSSHPWEIFIPEKSYKISEGCKF